MMESKSSGTRHVTVVIPVKNRASMLLRAVKSVLSQTYQDFDLVVVDDASDQDLSSVKALVEGEGHRWLRMKENLGPAAARNAGAELASGQWLAFLDSDDVWARDKLECQMAKFAENPEMEISQCEESWLRNGVPVKKNKYQHQPDGWIFETCVERCCISPSCVMLTRRLWQELGGFDTRYPVCEDYELWLRTSLSYPVGLVKSDSGPLVTRHGGHDDQLSFAVEAMDRFRLLAMLELLLKEELTKEQKLLLEKNVSQRASVLEKGALKRGKTTESITYSRAQKREWSEMAKEMERICFGELLD